MNWLHSYMACTAHTIAPDEFRYPSAILCIAAALGRKVTVKISLEHEQNAWKTPPNLYLLMVGPPDGGKTIAISQAERMLTEIGVPLAADTTTKAKMVERMAAVGGSMALVCGEFGVFMRGSGAGKNTADPELTLFLTRLYDLKPVFLHETVSSTNAELKDAFLTIIAATTPDDLRKLFPIVAGTGFLSRMLIVFHEKRAFKDDRAYLDMDLWVVLVEQLKQIQAMEGVIAFDEEATAAYRTWNRATFKKYEYSTTEEGSRLQDMVVRIAMCHAAAELSYVVTLDHFTVAVQNLHDILPGRKSVLQLGAGNPMRPVMESVLRFVENGGIQRSVYFDYHRDQGTKRQLQEALDLLVVARRITYAGDEPYRKIVAWKEKEE